MSKGALWKGPLPERERERDTNASPLSTIFFGFLSSLQCDLMFHGEGSIAPTFLAMHYLELLCDFLSFLPPKALLGLFFLPMKF